MILFQSTFLHGKPAGGYSARVSIDGVLTGITTYWSGGSAPMQVVQVKRCYTYQVKQQVQLTTFLRVEVTLRDRYV